VPNRGGAYQKFAIFNQYFRNTDTDTEYRTDMKKYRRKYRIPTPNTDTDPALMQNSPFYLLRIFSGALYGATMFFEGHDGATHRHVAPVRSGSGAGPKIE